jgi:hypothetical protein
MRDGLRRVLERGAIHRAKLGFDRWFNSVCAGLVLLSGASVFAAAEPPSLDLREPMAWAANAIPPRLDAAKGYQPWSLLRGPRRCSSSPGSCKIRFW